MAGMAKNKTQGILINNKRVRTDKTLNVLSPFNGEPVGSVYLAGEREFSEAIGVAEKAFQEIRKMPVYKRAGLIEAVARSMEGEAESLAKIIAKEAGKPVKDARVEVKRAANTFQIASEEAKRICGEVIPLDLFQGSEGRFGIVRRFPIGVVLGITPFNFPLNLVAHKVAPAMASGNSIIIKPASKTPMSALLLGDIIARAGWPAGGVNIVPCPGNIAERALKDERIKKLTFTGSADVGWRLKGLCNAKKVTLELGGNAGVIVDEDADIEFAAKRCVLGAFSYSGQVCISVQRIYAQKRIFRKFKDAFLGNCAMLKVGDPLKEDTDIGPMIDEASAIEAEERVKEAVSKGAKVLFGKRRHGCLFYPTVISNTTPEMAVCREEMFAPVAALEPFERFEDAVKEVNTGAFGLQAGVFTMDMQRVFYAYNELNVGGVVINDIPTYRVDHMPYGGVKRSGFGREGVRYSMEEMTELKLLALRPF